VLLQAIGCNPGAAKHIADRLRALVRQCLVRARTADAVGVGHDLRAAAGGVSSAAYAGGKRAERLGRASGRAVEFEQSRAGIRRIT
jgi:hypothetical protein